MDQKLFKFTLRKERGGPSTPRRTLRSRFLFPALVLGIMIMIMALRLGISQARDGHVWQKVGPTPALETYAPDHSPKWQKTLMILSGDNDDDDDGDDSTS
jgi:hypothetical protein